MITHTGIYLSLLFLTIDVGWNQATRFLFLNIELTPFPSSWWFRISLTFFEHSVGYTFPPPDPASLKAAEETMSEIMVILDKAEKESSQ